MTLEEFKGTDWYLDLPPLIKEAIELIPPVYLYRFKDSKKHCWITSFAEPKSGKIEDIQLTVQKTGQGGAFAEMGLGMLDTNVVFGVKPEELERVMDDIN